MTTSEATEVGGLCAGGCIMNKYNKIRIRS